MVYTSIPSALALKLTMRSHRTTLTQQFSAIHTQAMTRHTATREARARMHNYLYCAPPPPPPPSNPAELTQRVTATLPPRRR